MVASLQTNRDGGSGFGLECEQPMKQEETKKNLLGWVGCVWSWQGEDGGGVTSQNPTTNETEENNINFERKKNWPWSVYVTPLGEGVGRGCITMQPIKNKSKESIKK